MSNKYSIFLAVVILFLAGWLFFKNKPAALSNPQATAVVVLMKQDTLEPENLTVKKGAKVTFINEDKVARWPASNIHPTHSIYPEFDPKQPIEPGQSWQFTFEKTGEWKHHDHLLPSIRGTIVVTE